MNIKLTLKMMANKIGDAEEQKLSKTCPCPCSKIMGGSRKKRAHNFKLTIVLAFSLQHGNKIKKPISI